MLELDSGPILGSLRSSWVSVLSETRSPIIYGMHGQSFTAGEKDLLYMLFILLFPERQLAQPAFFFKNKVINDKLNNIQMTFLIKTAREWSAPS